MTQFIGLDIEAAEREGCTIIYCKGNRCTYNNPPLAAQSPDGKNLRFNQYARSYGSSDRVRLTCDCGYTREWRASNQQQHPENPNISAKTLKSS